MNYQLDLHGEMLMEQYHERLSTYKRIEQLAIGALRQALDTQRVRVTALESRIKAADSLAGKLELKGAKYNSLDDVTDILGIRIVTFYGTDVDKVGMEVADIESHCLFHKPERAEGRREMLDHFGPDRHLNGLDGSKQ